MIERSVLYISYDGMTDPLGQSQVLPYLTGLSKAGYRISLLSFEKAEKFQQFKTDIEKICNEAGINWYPQKYTKRPPILSTIHDVRVMKKTAASLHKQHGFSLVHCRSYISAMAGVWMKKKFGLPFVFDMRGFWTDERVDGNLWDLKNPLYKKIYRFFKNKEKEYLDEAAAIISLTHNAREEMLSWRHVRQPLDITVIPCCVDTNLFAPGNAPETTVAAKKAALAIPEGIKVITYIGSVGTWYLLDEMLDFFNVWLMKYPGSVFLFVTGDSPAHIFEKAALKNIAPEAIRVQFAKRNEVPLYIAMGDFSLFFIKPAYSKKASSPTKQGEIMSMGKPVICNARVGDTDYVVNKYHSGLVVEECDIAHYGEVVQQWGQARFDEAGIRDGAKTFYSLENGVHSYRQVYEDVLKKYGKALK